MKEVIRQYKPANRLLRQDEEFILIDPSNMTFHFDFGKEECHKQLTGICSLERKHPDRSQNVGDRCDYDICPELLNSMRRIGLHSIMNIEIAKCRCGHYEFCDGRHRVCIAKKKGIVVEAVIITIDEDCDVCLGRGDIESELR